MEDSVIALIESGRVNEAQVFARGSNVGGPAELRLMGILYHAVRDAEKARAYLERANSQTMRDPTIALRLAEVYCWQAEPEKAKSLVTDLPVAVLAGGARPWENQLRAASVWGCVQDFDAANRVLADAKASAELPDNIRLEIEVRRAELTSWQKQFDRALQLVDQVLAERPAHLHASLVKGQIQEWQGRYGAALLTYRTAFRVHPGDPALRARIARLSWVK